MFSLNGFQLLFSRCSCQISPQVLRRIQSLYFQQKRWQEISNTIRNPRGNFQQCQEDKRDLKQCGINRDNNCQRNARLPLESNHNLLE